MRFILLAIAITLTGCATDYQPKGFTGNGYSTTQLSEKTFVVNFKGNSATSEERVNDFTLLRSSEIAIKHGYTYFRVLDNKRDEQKSKHTDGSMSQDTDIHSMNHGDDMFAHGHTSIQQDRDFDSHTYELVEVTYSKTIECLENKPKTGRVYNAQIIAKSIRAKYDI